jgi:hypothetical protein
MTTPALIFGFLLSTLYAAFFHFWRNGGAGRLLLDLLLAWIGFWAGQYLAEQIGFTLADLGQLHVVPASICSLLFLFGGHWLSLLPEKK